MNILVLLKSTYPRLIGTFGVYLNRIYGCVIDIAISKHGLPVLCDINEAPRQGVPPIWDLHMGVLGNTGVYGSWWELAGVGRR